MSSNTTQNIHPRGQPEMSSDKKYLLIKRSSHSVFRRSSFGVYSILQLGLNGQHLKRSFELKPSGFVPTSPNDEHSHFYIRYVTFGCNVEIKVDFSSTLCYKSGSLTCLCNCSTMTEKLSRFSGS